jgi:hypothetical protein
MKKNRLIFVHIPKAAGGSIVKWGENNGIKFIRKPKHGTLEDIRRSTQVEENRFSFTVIRNTYRRLVSLYNWIPAKANKAIKNHRNTTLWQDHLDAFNKGILYWFDWYHSDGELLTQMDYIKDVNCILRAENLSEDFKIIQEKLNCYSPLVRTKHIGKYNYTEFISSKLIEKIDNYYYAEIQQFGYKP